MPQEWSQGFALESARIGTGCCTHVLHKAGWRNGKQMYRCYYCRHRMYDTKFKRLGAFGQAERLLPYYRSGSTISAVANAVGSTRKTVAGAFTLLDQYIGPRTLVWDGTHGAKYLPKGGGDVEV